MSVFKRAGALVGNAGCAGCAAGQIGQTGPGEVTVSTGNRNFAGKQGRGDVYLASPAVAAASAIAGFITTPDAIPDTPSLFSSDRQAKAAPAAASHAEAGSKPTTAGGRVWVIPTDDIDTDMIFHNRHLAVTEIADMGQHTFGNLNGWEDFSEKAKAGDIVVVAKNFGAGSSRQQAVDCFKSLGISLVIAESFGAIYERNAINAGFPIMVADLISAGVQTGDEIEVDFASGKIALPTGTVLQAAPFSQVQLEIYQRGGLLSG